MALKLLNVMPEVVMKYLFAWALGIPGGLIVVWFLFNHMH
jgi:hypothetical protein